MGVGSLFQKSSDNFKAYNNIQEKYRVKKIIWFINTLIFAACLLLSCATTRLEDYRPKNEQEQEVLEVLKKMIEARQNEDFEAYMAFFHDDAKIFKRQHPGSINGAFISKQEYANSPGEDFGIRPMLKDLQISIGEDLAILKCWDEFKGLKSLWIIDMEKEKGEWRVIKYEYTPYRRELIKTKDTVDDAPSLKHQFR